MPEDLYPGDYLVELGRAYQGYFAEVPPARLLWVDAVAADFVHRQEHLNRLIECLDVLPLGRQYFDPSTDEDSATD